MLRWCEHVFLKKISICCFVFWKLTLTGINIDILLVGSMPFYGVIVAWGSTRQMGEILIAYKKINRIIEGVGIKSV